MGAVNDKPANPSTSPPVTVEIGTLAITGVSRAYGLRAAASFEAALPEALAGLGTGDLRGPSALCPLDLNASPRLPPEEFGRRLAAEVAKGLKR